MNMNYVEIAAMAAAAAQAAGCPLTYYQWPVGKAPEPPYILFYYPYRDDFPADDRNFGKSTALRIELYTDEKDFVAEAAVEGVLEEYGMVYGKTESYIDDEHMFEILYDMEVMINA